MLKVAAQGSPDRLHVQGVAARARDLALAFNADRALLEAAPGCTPSLTFPSRQNRAPRSRRSSLPARCPACGPWDQVRLFTDGSWGLDWALRIVLHDGGVIRSSATADMIARHLGRPEMVAAIRQAAERHDILAILTGARAKKGQPPVAGLYADPGGKPWLREWTGTEWSPFLQLHPDDTDPTLRQLAVDVVRSGAGGPAAGVNLRGKSRIGRATAIAPRPGTS
jgi:hypothetical protein